jgi:hypothetical protein
MLVKVVGWIAFPGGLYGMLVKTVGWFTAGIGWPEFVHVDVIRGGFDP